MALSEQQLGQSRPSTTVAQSLYSPSSGTNGIIKSIIVCNTSLGSVTFDIYVSTGTTYDESTALYYRISLDSNSTATIDNYFVINNGGNIGIRSSAANALTFSVFGAEVS